MRLVLNEITKEFKGTTVLRNISMEVHGGIVCGIQGINGSGKTMLLRVMAGLLIPTNGTIIMLPKIETKGIPSKL